MSAGAELRRAVEAAPRGAGPLVVGIAGAVASGKTTLAGELAAELTDRRVAVVSTDGFLFPNRVLADRGLSTRKGFPESYDVDALRRFVTSARAGALPCSVPCYSHLIYDVDGEVTVPMVDVLVLEGLNVLSAAADLLDVGVYLDADEALLERWYRQRFAELCRAGRDDPASFYRSFAGLGDDEVAALADQVWRGVNLVNLREHVAPSAARASCVIRIGPDHELLGVTVRDDVLGAERS